MHHIEAACLYQMGQLDDAERSIRSAILLSQQKKITSIHTVLFFARISE